MSGNSVHRVRAVPWLLVFFLFLATSPPIEARAAEAGKDYHVSSFGAKGDGVTLDTRAIQNAIDRCAGEGGGRVVIGAGTYLSGTLVMLSNVELHVKKGGVLLGSTNIADYPEMVTAYRFYRDEVVKQSLIFGSKLKNIKLSGEGVIDGQGGAFQATTNEKPDRYRNRPFLIRFTECTGIEVKDLTLRNSAMWMQHYLACEDLLVKNIKVYNHCNKNNDMIDIDGCRNVRIEDCIGDTDDDALTLKSTSPRACENVSISGCIVSSHCNAIKMGTESTGGFKNITIKDCIVKPSSEKEVIYGYPEGISGISLEVVDGGVMDQVSISDIIIDGPQVPLFIRLGNRARPYMEGAAVPEPGILQNISIRDVLIKNTGIIGCSFTGLADHPARNISISGLSMDLPGGFDQTLDDVEVPELEDLYPEATMFGTLPASVFYLRHLDRVSLSDIVVSFAEKDARDPLVIEDVSELDYENITVTDPDGVRVFENK